MVFDRCRDRRNGRPARKAVRALHPRWPRPELEPHLKQDCDGTIASGTSDVRVSGESLSLTFIWLTMSLLAQLYALRWLLLCAVITMYVTYKYRKYDRLRHFKGPFSTGWSELWHSCVILGLHSHLAYKNVNDKYGEWLDSCCCSAEIIACSHLCRPYCTSWT